MADLSLDLDRGLYLGIDFGTTNTVVSVYDDEEDEIHTISIDGMKIFPTAVQFEEDVTEDNKLDKIFGKEAKESAIIYPESTVLNIKGLLSETNKVKIKVEGKDYVFTPEQIAGQFLEYIKEVAEEYVQDELDIMGEFIGCVITVPANSTDKQKKLTKNAGVLAGFLEEHIHIRLEPSAAAIGYAKSVEKNEKVLIYDFGGGTFDACILDIKQENKEPIISIVSTFGDNNLGGNDIDNVIIDIIYEKFKAITDDSIDIYSEILSSDLKTSFLTSQIKLKQVATQVKEKLSQSQQAQVVLTPLLQQPKIVNIEMTITRDEFLNHKRVNQLNQSREIFEKFQGKSVIDILNLTMESVDKCLSVAGLEVKDINSVFLVGGSSTIPKVSDLIESKFGKQPHKSIISPALSISQGASIYTKMILNSESKEMVREKTIHSLGIELAGRRFLPIVESGNDIPEEGLEVVATEPLFTNFDDISSMAIVVYEDTIPTSQGLSLVTDKGMKRLSSTQLRGIPKNKKGNEKVEIIFKVSRDNIITVEARSMSVDGVKTQLIVDELY